MATGPVADVSFADGAFTVSDIQKAIQEQTGIPQSMQRILQGGEILDTATQLSSSKVLEGCAAGSLAMVRQPESALYVLGGKCEGGDLAIVERFKPMLDCWSPVPPLRPLGLKRCRLQAVPLGGFIYAIGGKDSSTGSVLDLVERFDPVSNTWTSLEPMHSRRECHGVAVVNGKIFVVGGSDGRGALSTAECFDPESNSWEIMPPLQVRRQGLALAVVGNFLYAIGGQCGEKALRCTEMLDCSGHVNQKVRFSSNGLSRQKKKALTLPMHLGLSAPPR